MGLAAALALRVSGRCDTFLTLHSDTQPHLPPRGYTLRTGGHTLHKAARLHQDAHRRPRATHAINTPHRRATDHKRHTATPSRAHRPFACFVFTRQGCWQGCVCAYVRVQLLAPPTRPGSQWWRGPGRASTHPPRRAAPASTNMAATRTPWCCCRRQFPASLAKI